MVNYLIRRLILGALTLLLVTFIVFALIRNMPGTPLTLNMAETDPSKKISKENMEILNRAYGLDRPWPVAYVHWLGNLARLDLGDSFREGKPVIGVIGQRIGPTLLLSTISIVLAYLLAVPLGLYATARSGKIDERTTSVFLYALYSLPSYVAAMQLLYVFYYLLRGTVWQLKPGMVSDDYSSLSLPEKVTDIGWHLLLPLICFTYANLAYDSRFIKANMEEAIRQDYIRTARAKGAGRFRVLVLHAFRNTLIPFVTLLGLQLPGLLGGAIILEQIFSWPGMGRLFFDSITYRDYPVIMGLTLMLSILTLAGQLLADFLYAIVDPRITYS
jgi:peptide/nickel transport system permease protein